MSNDLVNKYKKNTYNSFYMLGRVYPAKDPIQTFSSGVSVKLNVKCGNSTFTVKVLGFKPKSNKVTVFTKEGKMQLPYNEAINITDKFTEAQPSYLDESGVSRYATKYDFAMHLKGLVECGVINGQQFKIRGDITSNCYLGADGLVKSNTEYLANKFELLAFETPKETEYATANIGLYLPEKNIIECKNSMILSGLSIENQKINGEYTSAFVDFNIEIPIPSTADKKKVVNIHQKMYKSSDKNMKFLRVFTSLINGAVKIPITESMLTSSEKALIEAGFKTFEEIRDSKGSGYSERVRKIVLSNHQEGYGTPLDSAISINTYPHLKRSLASSNLELNGSYANMETQKPLETPNNFNAIDDSELPF